MADRTETERRPDSGENGAVGLRATARRTARRRSRRPRCPATSRARPSPAARCSPAARWRPAASRPPRSCCPRSGSRSGPCSRRQDFPWQHVGPPTDFSADNYTPVTFTLIGDASARPARRLAYVRKRNPAIDGEIPGRVRRDLDPLRAPRLPGALGEPRAAVRVPLPRRRVQRAGRGRGRPAGAAARPLRDAGRRTGRSSSARATASTRS